MPILDNQQRLARAGRIRMGERQGNRPVKLDHFRITSASRENLVQVADVYGGEVTEWNDGNSDDTHQVTITADEIDILIPMSPGAFSDWYESWTAGGLKNRCDGQYDELNERDCTCVAGKRICKPYTRLNVWLPKVETLGTWLLTSTGYNSNAELGGVVTAIQNAANALGRPIKATMRIDQRKQVVDRQTRRFPVPVIEAREPVGAIMEAVGGRQASLPLPKRPEQPSLAAPPPVDNMTWPDGEPDVEFREDTRTPGMNDETPEVDYETLPENEVVEPEPVDTSQNVIADNLQKQIVISCREVGIEQDDWHEMVNHVTEGRTNSTKELREGELPAMWSRMTTALSIKTAQLMRQLWESPTDGYAALHDVEGLERDVKQWGWHQWKLAYDHCRGLLDEQTEVVV